MVNNNLKLNVELNTQNAEVNINKLNKGFKDFSNQTQNAQKGLFDFENSMKKIKVSLSELAKPLLTIKTGMDFFTESSKGVYSLANSYIELNASYEKTQKNLASLIAVTHSNISTTNKVLNLNEKYSLSLKKASKTMENFNKLSVKSGYATKDLSEIFKSFYLGASKSLSFDESIKAFENLMQTLKISGIEVNQLKATMDGLGSGSVLSSSDLGRFLKQIDLSNDAIKEAVKNGTLFNLIMEKTSSHTQIAALSLGSYEDNLNLLKNNFDNFRIELSKPYFDKLNQGLASLNDFIAQNEKQIKDFIKSLQELSPYLLNLGIGLVALKAYTKLMPVLTGSFSKWLKAIKDTQKALYLKEVALL